MAGRWDRLSLTASRSSHRAHFGPLIPGVHHVPYGFCHRCPYQLKYGSCGIECVNVFEKVVFRHEVAPDEVAAIFVEPMQGEGGYIVPPPEYLPMLQELCRKHGILLVADEIQSGFGRTGKMFACEHWGIEPDILCTAKGIASGMPLGAMIARDEISTWTARHPWQHLRRQSGRVRRGAGDDRASRRGFGCQFGESRRGSQRSIDRAQATPRRDRRRARFGTDDRCRFRTTAVTSRTANCAIASCNDVSRKVCCCSAAARARCVFVRR